MKISDWLDEKEAEKVDVARISLPKNMVFDEDPNETVFLQRKIPAGCSVPKIIPLRLSNVLATGIIVEVRTEKPAFIQQK